MQRLKRRKDSMREMSQWCSKLIHEGEEHGASEENIYKSPEKPDDVRTVSRIDRASMAPSSIFDALLRNRDSDTSEEKLHSAKKLKGMKDHVKEMSQWCGQVIHEDKEHSVSEEKNDETPKGSIAETDVKALVDLIFKWSKGGDGVLERAAGALANLAADEKCSVEVQRLGVYMLW